MKKSVLLFLGVFSACLIFAGERLYNGIVLPDEWPPRANGACRMPEVVPVDIGRQFFTDDGFLIEEMRGVERVAPEFRELRRDVFDGAAGSDFFVWRDERAGDYKMWYGVSNAVYLASSSDGLNWTRCGAQVSPKELLTDSFSVVGDYGSLDRRQSWKMFLRGVGCAAGMEFVSPDARQWRRFSGGADGCDAVYWNPFRRKWEMSVSAGADGRLDAAVAYESVMLGTAGGHFVFSRDGYSWKKLAARTGRMKMMGNLCTLRKDELWFYHAGEDGKIGISSLRRDGFAGLKADGRGTVLTRPVIFRGNRLFVNIDASRGRVALEILDVNGEKLRYTGGEARGDHTAKEIVFEEGTLERAAGRPVRLRFTLENATLYSFWASASRTGASGGYLAGGAPGCTALRDIAPLYDGKVDEVDPLDGVAQGLAGYRGVYVPGGSVRISPNAAYSYDRRDIEGFYLMPADGGDTALEIMPEGRSRFSHDREKVELGYYSADLLSSGIRAEASASAHCAIMRFAYPQGKPRRLRIRYKGGAGARLRRGDGNSLESAADSSLRVEFSEPPAAVKPVAAEEMLVEFAPGPAPVTVKAALSAENAAELLAREIPSFSFRKVHDEARRLWTEALDRGGMPEKAAKKIQAAAKSDGWKFFDRRLGMFVHWGIYSVGAWHEQEWMRRRMAYDDYCRFADGFSAENFNADRLVETARVAGAEYIVVTAKHHDGFCMWDTKTTDFSSMFAPSGRDLIGEIAESCSRLGMKLGFYYSNPDWHHPSAYNTLSTHQLTDAQAGHVPDLKHYIRYVREQVRELMTNYGDVCCLFWDIPSRIEVPELNEMVRGLQPGIVINDRGWGSRGDYSTPERSVPPGNAFPRATEACDSLGVQCWGYRDDEDYRTLGYLTRAIDRTLARGGNFLLNIGPKPDGTLPEEGVALMRRVGRWYAKVRESYRDVETVPGLTQDGAIATRRGGTLYLHYPDGVHSTGLDLCPMKRLPRSAEVLNTGTPLRPVLEALPSKFWSGIGKTLRLSGVPADGLSGETVVVKMDFSPESVISDVK